MGLFGSSSSSKSYSYLTEQNAQAAPTGDLDRSNVLGLVGSGNVISFSDQGAFDLAGGVVGGAYDIISQSLDNISEANDVAAQTTQLAVDRGLAVAERAAADQSENLTSQFLTYAMIGGAIFGLVVIFRGKK